MYIFKFIRFFYSNYKILKYKSIISKYTNKLKKVEDAITMGFISEAAFQATMRDKWNKVKPKKTVPKVNEEGKKRIQKLAGIKNDKKVQSIIEELEFNDIK